MSIAASDILFLGSASMPDDDGATNIGGAIDTATKIVFTDIVATDHVEIVSDNAADTTQTVTVYGRNAAGELISEAETLNGTTPVATSAAQFERIMKITLSAPAAGVVVVRDATTGTAIATLEAGITQVRQLFYGAAADVPGGSPRDYYDKFFVKNAHGSLTATSAVVKEQADPSGNLSFALEASLNGASTNGSGNNRRTAGDWSGLTFDSADKNVPNSQNLTAGSAIGVIAKLSLAAGTAAAKSSVTFRLSFETT